MIGAAHFASKALSRTGVEGNRVRRRGEGRCRKSSAQGLEAPSEGSDPLLALRIIRPANQNPDLHGRAALLSDRPKIWWRWPLGLSPAAANHVGRGTVMVPQPSEMRQ
jgi:hypothetical protein